MAAYRKTSNTDPLKAVHMGEGCAPAAADPARPTLIDFRCDVEKVIRKCLKGDELAKFIIAYVVYDSDDSIEMEIRAQNVFSDTRHNLEQGLGALFIKQGLDKGYFHHLRVPRGRV